MKLHTTLASLNLIKKYQSNLNRTYWPMDGSVPMSQFRNCHRLLNLLKRTVYIKVDKIKCAHIICIYQMNNISKLIMPFCIYNNNDDNNIKKQHL